MSASGALRPAWLRRRLDLRRIVMHDFPLKAAALLIALLLVVANAQSAAPRVVVAPFNGRVPVERPAAPSGYVLRGQLGDVAVTLRGPEGVVGRIALTDLSATIDVDALDRARSELQDAKVDVAVANRDVQVIDVSPATVSVRLERITTRTLPVQARYANEPPAGSRAGEASISPNEVKVSGPESEVARIAALYATVRFGDAMTDVTQSAPAIPVDAAGQPVDGLEVEPGVVTVSVPVLPTATTRTVPVAFGGRGAVAAGYWVSSVSTDPVAVTVRGEERVLASLDRVETIAVDVTGLNVSRTVRATLNLPEGVTLVRPTDATVSVTLTVRPLTGTRAFSTAVQVTGIGAGLVAEPDPPTVLVVVSGELPALAALAAEQVTATVDGTGRGPGSHELDVAVRVGAGVTAQSVQPARVTLTIRAR